jgi:hypothetical protein
VCLPAEATLAYARESGSRGVHQLVVFVLGSNCESTKESEKSEEKIEQPEEFEEEPEEKSNEPEKPEEEGKENVFCLVIATANHRRIAERAYLGSVSI